MDLDSHYRLAAHAAIRPERFGGLVYRHDNRRLYFLHSPDLVTFLSALDASRSLGALLDEFLAARALPASAREIFVRALLQLEQLKILDRVSPLKA
ncbi:MAG: mycofactocin biosynthesis chaperone MftB [Chloroflexales bacterium]|nr:mycofactocin biosynthesis chaperone MftB [Chloroflexales bacterium]